MKLYLKYFRFSSEIVTDPEKRHGSKKDAELELRRQTIETLTNSSTRYNLTLSADLNVTSRVNGVNHQIPNVRSDTPLWFTTYA